MAFENIGFTHPVQPLTNSGKPLISLMKIPHDNVFYAGRRLKLLACAECDLGPLGWSEEGACEYWLACSRVGYAG